MLDGALMMRDGKRWLSCHGWRHARGSLSGSSGSSGESLGMIERCAPFDPMCGSSKGFIGRTNGAGKGDVLFNPDAFSLFVF